MRALLSTAAVVFLLAGGTAFAGPKTKVSVLFQDFPEGTQCSAQNVRGKLIRKEKRGHPKVDIRGYGEVGVIFCNLPDGRTIVTDVNKRLPDGTRTAGITVYPDGRTFLTASTSAGLVSQEFANTLKDN